MHLSGKSFMMGLLAGAAVPLAYSAVKWILKNEKKEEDISISDCLLFLPQGMSSNTCLKGPSDSCEYCSKCNCQKLIKVIESAKSVLSVCMYLITSKELTDSLIMLHKKGVLVRIITDKQMSEEAQNAKIVVFLKHCIPIRVVRTDQIMHNKFVLVDNKLLITGSLNWTRQGIESNFENAVILNDVDIVKEFVKYFETLWHAFTANNFQ